MDDWLETTVGELCRIKHGFAFKGEFFVEDGDLTVLSPGNFLPGGGLQLRAGKETYYEGEFPPEFLLDEGDLLVAMTDLKQDAPILGSTIRVPESGRYLHNQRLGLVTDIAEHVDPGFLYYLLNSDIVRSWLRATATGSTVRHTAPERIYAADVRLPPLEEQIKIAESLEALDQLTENNRQRVEILEEMARLIYREWFVRFRLPGQEKPALVDSQLGGIPEGWGVRPLSAVLELVYGKALKADRRRDGDAAVYGSGGIVGWHDEALVDGPGIVVGRKGNVGAVYWSDVDFYPIDTTYFVKTQLPLSFVYHQLQTLEFLDSHAAVPGLSRDQAYDLKVVVPPDDVLLCFDGAVSPMYALRRNLIAQNDVLGNTRDLLLPPLISGHLDVSDLDLDLKPAV